MANDIPPAYDADYPNRNLPAYDDPQSVYGGSIIPLIHDRLFVHCPKRDDVSASILDCCTHCTEFYGAPVNEQGFHIGALCTFKKKRTV